SVFSKGCTFTENQYMANLDYVQSDKAKVAVRLFDARSDETQPLAGGNAALEVAPGFSKNKFQVGSVTYSYVVNPRVFNEFRVHLFEVDLNTDKRTNFKFSDFGINAPASLIETHPVVQILGSYSMFTVPSQKTQQQTWGFHDNVS